MIKDSTVTFICATLGLAAYAYAAVDLAFLWRDQCLGGFYGGCALLGGLLLNCCGIVFGVLTMIRRAERQWLGALALGLNLALITALIIVLFAPIHYCPYELVE